MVGKTGQEKKAPARSGVSKTVNLDIKSQGAGSSQSFFVVGIGASAGGLEALEQFFSHVPPDSGMAFVIVQHLDPTHKGIMPELLQRVTKMSVMQVKDNTTVLPDHVYVIPPNKDLSILHGVLYLLDPSSPRGLRLPIDFFFRSLAKDQAARSIGVILSGMGTDGTAGLRAIKENAGIAFIQEPASAKFDGMPQNAIDNGLADIVAPAVDLPARIIAYLSHVPDINYPEPVIEEKSMSSLAKIYLLIREHTGHDFSFYKKTSVYRRVERRMAIHQIDKIATYVRFLQENPGEQDLLFHELLIGVTSFFRDPEAWDSLRDTVIPSLVRESPARTTIRAWVAGCSTGEEAYSLAIVFIEAMEMQKKGRSITLQIFATDIDRDAIEKARQGYFPPNIASDVSPERLGRFFTEEGSGYRVKKEIRETVIFATQNIIMDPPFTKLDILCCRNLLIYLEPELQKKLIPLFFYSLKPGGVLFLGTAETIGRFSSLFTSIENKQRIYKRRDTVLLPEQIEFPVRFLQHTAGETREHPVIQTVVNISALADQLILQKYSPPAVLTTDTGDIIYVNGRTGNYLEPASGKANWNIFAMAREGLRYELSGAFQKTLRERQPVTVQNMRVRTNGREYLTDCTVHVIEEPRELAGMVLITFTETVPEPEEKDHGKGRGTSKSRNARIIELETELERNRDELQTIREEMQTSQEELRSSNEEMQSTNEELQSTNEELTTSKEEMQSMNEELQTVNAELQSRIEEFSRTNNDMRNLLNSTEVATIFLDDAMNIRRFTTPVTRIINLKPGDEGRPITDISSELNYPNLVRDGKNVLETLIFSDREIPTNDGRWFRIRIMPYRTLENMIDGVVITFFEITAIKQKEQDLLAAGTFTDAIISTIREPLLVLDNEMKIIRANRSFYQVFHVKKEETEEKFLYSLGNGQWDIPDLRKLLEQILPEKKAIENYVVRYIFPEIGERVMELNARRLMTKGPSAEFILLAIEDVTDRKGGAGQ